MIQMLKPIMINHHDAASLRRKAANHLCSAPWIGELVFCARVCNGSIQWYCQPNVYPPGGQNTLMCTCQSCKRISPPDVLSGNLCCDCDIEASEERHLKMVRSLEYLGARSEMNRLFWHHMKPYSEFMNNPWTRSAINVDPSHEANSAGLDDDDPDMAWTEDEDADRGKPRRISEEQRRIAIQISIDRFKKRGGCYFDVLPEDEPELQKEIAYYNRTGRILPRAQSVGFYN